MGFESVQQTHNNISWLEVLSYLHAMLTLRCIMFQ